MHLSALLFECPSYIGSLHLCHSVVSLGKTLNGTFLYWVVLASSSIFQLYLYKTKQPNKKLQPDSNTLASPEAEVGVIVCPRVVNGSTNSGLFTTRACLKYSVSATCV